MRCVLALALICACNFPRPEDVGPHDGAPDAGPTDFTVTLEHSRVRIAQNSQATVEVTLGRNAFTEPVTLTVADPPPGVSIDPLTIEGSSGVLTLHVAANAAQGEATLIVTAASESRSHDAPLSLLAMGPPGTLDQTFGAGGTLTAPMAGRGTAVVIQPDGKIVVASTIELPGAGAIGSRLTRYLPNGTLDTGFAGGAISFPSIGETCALALQPDGKVLLATTVGNGNTSGLIARFNPDGSPDREFGIAGRRLLDVNDLGTRPLTEINAIAVQPDGGILVAGATQVKIGDNDKSYAMVARLGPTGILDSSFGIAGRRTIALQTGFGRFLALALQPDGGIVAVGQARTVNTAIAAFARFDSEGRIDTTFSDDGYLIIDLGDSSSGTADFKSGVSVVVQPDKKVLIAGGSSNGPFTRSCLIRLNGDGVPDSTFGMGGVKVVPMGTGFFDSAHGVALQPDGKFVVVGQALTPVSNGYVARFQASGQIDLGFAGGLALPPPIVGDVVARLQAVALDADGRIVVTGGWELYESPDQNLVVDRFWP